MIYMKYLSQRLKSALLHKEKPLVWGGKVSLQFCERVISMGADLETDPDWLMASMAFETRETFSPSIKNAAGSGARGLIQFMPLTARDMGTTVGDLSRMTALEQLEYVYAYFKPYKGRLNSLADVYMAILWPRAVGKPLDYVLWEKGKRPTTYRQNSGLDINNDKRITKRESTSRVRRRLKKGKGYTRYVDWRV